MTPYASPLRPYLYRLFLGGVLACLLPVIAAAQAPPDTLEVDLSGAIERALEASPEVGDVASERDYAAARLRLAQASRFLTEFQVTTGHSLAPGLKGTGTTPSDELYLNPDVRNDWDNLNPYNRIQVDALQPVFTWGELSGNLRAARHGVDVEEASIDQKEAEVALRTGELYMNILLAEALEDLADRAGDVVQQAMDEIQRLLDEGAEDVDDADLFEVRITEQEFNQRVVEVTQRLATARVALVRQLFLPEGTVVVPQDAVLEPLAFTLDSLDVYHATALDHRPELAQAEAGLAARSALVDVARAQYYPRLFIGLQASLSGAAGRIRQPSPYVGDPFRGRSVQAGFGLRQNLNVFQTKARVEQAEAERNQVVFQQDAARQLILFEVEEAYRNLIIAQASLDARDQALTLSKEWLQSEYVNFQYELGDTENLVRAVRSNLQLEASYYEAVQAYNLAVLRLLRRTGTLVSRVQSGTLVE